MQSLEDLSKERLINDLVKLRNRIEELEKIKEEKEKYAAELAQTKAMYEGLFQFAPDAILVVNNKGIIIRANQEAERLFGYAREQLIGLDHDVVVPDRFRKRHLEEQRQYISAPRVRRMGTGLELYGRRKDGTEFCVDISLGPLQAKDEIVTLAIVRDMTERKNAEETLRESEERFRALVTASSEVLYRMNPDWSEMRQLTSRGFLANTEKPSGTWLQEYIHADDQPHVTSVINEAIRTKSIFELEHRVKRADGSIGWTHSRAVPLMDKNGEVVEWFGAASDISERKRSEMALKEQAQRLEDVNKELESFSYSISHDLRAPLRAIDGYTRMILKKHADKFDEDSLVKFNVIRDNTRVMAQLIEDVLAFSRLGQARLSLAKLDMNNMIKEIWKEVAGASPNRRLSLKIANLTPCLGDRILIKQVLVNLLANAVKFTGRREEALIEVGGEVKGGENLYYIRDNGAGFDMAYYDKLFGIFSRLHTDSDFEGTGVGLSIVQRIIHRHGGRVWAEGKVDEGATFYFTLPTLRE